VAISYCFLAWWFSQVILAFLIETLNAQSTSSLSVLTQNPNPEGGDIMCNPETKIIIDSRDTAEELLGCYFQFVEERDELFIYKFFDQKGTEIIGDLHVGMKFNFALGSKNWLLNITASSCEIVRGLWTDAADWEPDQPYQAQAGGTLSAATSTAAATA